MSRMGAHILPRCGVFTAALSEPQGLLGELSPVRKFLGSLSWGQGQESAGPPLLSSFDLPLSFASLGRPSTVPDFLHGLY